MFLRLPRLSSVWAFGRAVLSEPGVVRPADLCAVSLPATNFCDPLWSVGANFFRSSTPP